MADEDNKPKWIGLSEAIEDLMRLGGLSRRAARDRIVKAAKAGKLKIHRSPKPPESTAIITPAQTVPPDETARLFRDEPEALFWTFDDFVFRFGFSPEQLHKELASGRLRASTRNEDALFAMRMKLGGSWSARDFEINGADFKKWLTNPRTPPYLIEQLIQALKKH